MTEADRLRIGFTLRGLDGLIDVSLTRNTDPGSLGYLLLSGYPEWVFDSGCGG